MSEDFGNYEPTPEKEAEYKRIGAPSYFGALEARSRAQERRGPGSVHRRIHPSTGDLTQDEADAYRIITTRYDREARPFGSSQYANIQLTDFSPKRQKGILGLEGLGFLRIEEDGRIVPTFVTQEHHRKAKPGGPAFKAYMARLRAEIEASNR